MNGYYGLPAGKIENNESFLAGTVREALEEVGVTINHEDLVHVHTMHRHAPDMDWVDIYFEAKTWQGEPYNAEPHSSSELSWLDINNLPENVIDSVKQALEHIQKGQSYSEHGWR